MIRIAAVLVAVGASASALATPFTALSYEGGGGLPNISGQGFTTSGSGFYNRTGATTTSVLASDVTTWTETTTNHVAYDSYLTLSGTVSRVGSATGIIDTLSPQLNAIYGNATEQARDTAVVNPGSHIGDNDGPNDNNPPTNRVRAGIAAIPVSGGQTSVINANSGLEGVFLAQLTVNRGATISGDIFFTTLVQPGFADSNTLVLGGPAVLFETAPGVFTPLVLRAYLVATNDDLSHSRSFGNEGSGTPGSTTQRFGPADVYHLWVDAIPAPTAVAAFSFAGLAALRRRRA